MNRLFAFVLGLALAFGVRTAWTAVVTPGADLASGDIGPALLDPADDKIRYSHQRPTTLITTNTVTFVGGDSVDISGDFVVLSKQIRATGGLVWQNTESNTGTATGTHTVTSTSTSIASEPTIKAVTPFLIDGPYSDMACGQFSGVSSTVGCAIGSSQPTYSSVFLAADEFTSRLGSISVEQTSLLAGNGSATVGCALSNSSNTFACDSDVALVGSNLTAAGEALADVHRAETITGGGDYAFAYRTATGTHTATNTGTGTGTACPYGSSCTMYRTSTTTSTAIQTNSINNKSIALNPTLTYTDVGALPPNGVSVSTPSLITSATDGQIYNSRAMNSGDVTGALGYTPASRALDNLSSVAVNASILPGTSATIDLGSTSYKWRAAYFSGQVNAATVYTTGDISSDGAVYGDNLTSAGHAAADVAAADLFTFGSVFTNSSPGYFETNSTDYVDVFTVSIASVPSGTHYLNATSAMAASMSAGSCYMRMVLDSTAIGNEAQSSFLYIPATLTAGHVSVGSGTHTLHIQIKQSIGGINYCRVASGAASASGMVGPS